MEPTFPKTAYSKTHRKDIKTAYRTLNTSLAYDAEFATFIGGLLRRGRLSDKYISKLLSRKTGFLGEFKIAFTHKSMTSDNYANMEYYEFLGDSIVNGAIPWWIESRHPEIRNIAYIAKIKSKFQSKRPLSEIAMRAGFERYLLVNQEDLKIFDGIKEDRRGLKEYLQIFEDAFEAFLGCMMSVMLKYGSSRGLALEACTNVVLTLLDESMMDLSYGAIFDPVTRLQNLYKGAEYNLNWPGVEYYLEKDTDQNSRPYTTRYRVYGWPRVNGKLGRDNRILLAEGDWSVDDDLAKQSVISAALNVLDQKYGIRDNPVSVSRSKVSWGGFYKMQKRDQAAAKRAGGDGAGGPGGWSSRDPLTESKGGSTSSRGDGSRSGEGKSGRPAYPGRGDGGWKPRPPRSGPAREGSRTWSERSERTERTERQGRSEGGRGERPPTNRPPPRPSSQSNDWAAFEF